MAKILLKRSATLGVVPLAGELDLGEMAINTADGKVFIKKTNNAVIEVGSSVIGNIDGGEPNTNYGGITSIDGGGV